VRHEKKEKTANYPEPHSLKASPNFLVPACMFFQDTMSESFANFLCCKQVQSLQAVKQTMLEARCVLEEDITDLWKKSVGLPQTLHRPEMMVAGVIGWLVAKELEPERVNSVTAVAGVDAGEIAALVTSGVFQLKDALILMKAIREAFHIEFASNDHGLIPILGLQMQDVERFCSQARMRFPGQYCEVVTMNGLHTAVCGDLPVMIHLGELLKTCDIEATLFKELPPLHTPKMRAIKAHLTSTWDQLMPRMRPPQMTVFMGADCRPVEPGEDPSYIKSLIEANLEQVQMGQLRFNRIVAGGYREIINIGDRRGRQLIKVQSMNAYKITTNLEDMGGGLCEE